MKFDIDLLESDSIISRQILIALQKEISSVMQNITKTIEPKIKAVIANALRAEPEYMSLTSGQLKYELGIPDQSSVDSVIEKLINTLEIELEPVTASSRSIRGGFILRMMRSADLNGIIADKEAFVIDQERGYELPWLEWLLLRGNQILVKKYSVKIGSNPQSRTGNAIMVSSSSNWRVPTEFAGTQTNNWTTRAVSVSENAITRVIEQAVRNAI